MVHRVDEVMGDVIAPAQTFDPFYANGVGAIGGGFGFTRAEESPRAVAVR